MNLLSMLTVNVGELNPNSVTSPVPEPLLLFWMVNMLASGVIMADAMIAGTGMTANTVVNPDWVEGAAGGVIITGAGGAGAGAAGAVMLKLVKLSWLLMDPCVLLM